MNKTTKVWHQGKSYVVQLPRTHEPLVSVYDASDNTISELLHPVDCLQFGVHNGGYFNSQQSLDVHAGKDILLYYFTYNQLGFLPAYYDAELTQFGHPHRNYFGVSASSSLQQWLDKGWIQPSAPEGWFEAYTQHCSGYLCDTDWAIEQKRYMSFVSRHAAQVAANCPGDLTKRKKQRQALLNWASPLAFL